MPKKLLQYPAVARPVQFEADAVPETITLDKWFQPIGIPVIPRRTLANQYPSFFAHSDIPAIPPETTTLDKWSPIFPLRPTRKLREISYTIAFRGGPEEITPDKWGAVYPVKTYKRKNAQYLYPHHFFHPVPIPTITAEIELDRWLNYQPIPRKRQHGMHLYGPAITERIETGTARRVKLEPMGILRQW